MDTNTFYVRPYQDEDWKDICRVHDLARPDELRGSCDPRAFVPLAKDDSAGDVHTSQKWVACVGEQVVGFVGVEETYLSWLYVDPTFYGRGIGRHLLRLGVQQIGPEAWTIALAGNQRAVNLYESEGFEIQKTFEGENAGYPCIVARLVLNSNKHQWQKPIV